MRRRRLEHKRGHGRLLEEPLLVGVEHALHNGAVVQVHEVGAAQNLMHQVHVGRGGEEHTLYELLVVAGERCCCCCATRRR